LNEAASADRAQVRGLLEASNGGTAAVIAGGTIEFDAASSVAVTFDNGTGACWH
jgi:hypothetical protein